MNPGSTFKRGLRNACVQRAGGRPLPGTYPPNAETRARYSAWLRAHPDG